MQVNAILETAQKLKAAGESSPRAGRDPVNLPLIRNWIEAQRRLYRIS